MELQNIASIIFVIVFSTAKDCHGCFSYNLQQTISIKTGSAFYQECHCSEKTDSVDSLKWKDPHGEEIQRLGLGTSTVFTETQAETRTVSLHIPRISKSTSGPYTCVTTHKGQKYENKFLIEAYDPVYFVNTEETQFLISGQDSVIHCEARGDTEPLITWYLYMEQDEEERRILKDDKYSIEEGGLKIMNVNLNDNGTYKCTAAVLETGEEVERYINVEVLTIPVIEEMKVTPNPEVVVGEHVTIECLAHGFPHPEYYWATKDLNNGTWKQELNTISFESITAEDRGVYQCTASNQAGNATKDILIEVLEPPVIEEFSNVTALEGSINHVICVAKGKPAPNITILTEPSGLDNDPNAVTQDTKNGITGESRLVLSFHEVKREYEGRYDCMATNKVGEVDKEIYFTVLYKPQFPKNAETSLWGWMGKTVNLSCEHESNPKSTIAWRHQGNDIETAEQVTINKLLNPEHSTDENNAELQFVTLTIDRKSLFGLYDCTASNKYGESTKTIKLIEGFPPPELQNYTVKDITTNTVAFDLQGPETVNGPPVLGFTTEYDEEENYKITSIHRNRTWSKDRPFRVDRLKSNTTYYFKFAAVNEVGIGIWSDTLKVVTLEPSVPDPPVFEEEEAGYSTEESSTVPYYTNVLKWKIPSGDEDTIDYYVIKYCPVDNEEIQTELCKEELIAPTSQIDLRQLHQNTTFYIELVAHNSKGNSSVVEHYFTTPAIGASESTLSAGAMIGLSVIVVVLCILALDLVLFCWRQQGLIASCYYRKSKKSPEDPLMSRDKKGLLRDSQPTSDDALRGGHKQFEYNKTTGVITGKHSAV